MSTSKPYRELLRIATPIILGQIGIILVSFMDNIMVGHYDTDHFASASFVNNVFALVYVLGSGFAYGLTPLVTTAWTEGKPVKAGIILRLSLYLNLAFTLLAWGVMTIVYYRLDSFGLAPELLPIVRPYFLLHYPCLLCFMLFFAFKQFFDGIGRVRVGMWMIFISIAINLVGNWLFIYGRLGMPEWGLFGAGVATMIARFVALAFIAFAFCLGGDLGQARRGFFSWLYSKVYVQKLLRLSIPVATYAGVESSAFTMALLFVTPLGKLPLAVHQILSVVTTLGFFMYYGLGAATTILVSRRHTLGDRAGVRSATRVGLELSLGIAVVAMVLMYAIRDVVGRVFTEDEEIIRMTSFALIPVILYQLGDALQVLYANALRAIQDVKWLAIYACLVHLLLEPLLSYLFAFRLGLMEPLYQLIGVWSAFPIGLLLLGVLFRCRFVASTRL